MLKKLSNLLEFKKGVIALICSALIWGAATPILKKSLETVPPFSMAFLRFLIATIIILPFSKKFSLQKVKPNHLPKIFKASFFGVTLNIGFLFLGASLTSGLHIAIIISLVPVFTAITAHRLLKEKMPLNKIIGIALGFLGALIIIGEPLFEAGTTPLRIEHIIGDILVIISVLAWVGYIIENKELDKLNSYHPLEILPISFSIGIISFFPLAITEFVNNPGWIENINTASKFGIFYYGFFSSFLAYLLFTFGLSKTSATTAGLSDYLIPIISIILSIPILGEKISSFFLIGAIFIASGLILTEIDKVAFLSAKPKSDKIAS